MQPHFSDHFTPLSFQQTNNLIILGLIHESKPCFLLSVSLTSQSCTFRFLQLVLPAVTFAPDELLFLQAPLDRTELEHVKPSVLSWKQNKRPR